MVVEGIGQPTRRGAEGGVNAEPGECQQHRKHRDRHRQSRRGAGGIHGEGWWWGSVTTLDSPLGEAGEDNSLQLLGWTEATATPQVEVALQYNDGYAENCFTYCNNVNTVEGGTHLSGFRSALTRTINNYARASGLLKEDDVTPTGDDEATRSPVGVLVRFRSTSCHAPSPLWKRVGTLDTRIVFVPSVFANTSRVGVVSPSTSAAPD